MTGSTCLFFPVAGVPIMRRAWFVGLGVLELAVAAVLLSFGWQLP
jgi:hypothetical protein